MEEISGIILNVSYPKVGDTSNVEILGKTCGEWVKIALSDSYTASVAYNDITPLPQLVGRFLDTSSTYTVVLFSETALIMR